MKNYVLYLLLISCFTLLSCKKSFLDIVPDNISTLDMAFENKFGAEKYLYTCYGGLPSTGEYSLGLAGGDERWYTPLDIQNLSAHTRFATGNQTAASPLYNSWNGYYISIRRCNIFLDNVDKVLGVTQAEKDRWRGEATFLKAYYHFLLARMYGPIIIQDVQLPPYSPQNELVSERSGLDECFRYIIEQLDKAIELLPSTLLAEAAEKGRVTKAVAAAIKAKVWITYASPLFNGNTSINLKNTKGEPLFNPNYDESRWVEAAKACKSAIELCQANGAKILEMSDVVFNFNVAGGAANLDDKIKLQALLRSRVTERLNREAIFVINHSTDGLQRAAMPRLESYREMWRTTDNRYAPTLKVVEMYYSKNGVPIDEDKTYPYASRYSVRKSNGTTDDKLYVAAGEDTAVLNFDREPRFYSDLAFDRAVYYFNGVPSSGNTYTIKARPGEPASKAEPSQYSSTGYWAKKLVNMQSLVQNGNSFSAYQYGWPEIRLADLYLYCAEALNESYGPTDEAITYVDQIRKRAGLKGVKESWQLYSKDPSKPDSKTGLRDIIQRERLIEMAFEGSRFWDLRRWKLAEIYLNQPVTGWSTEEKFPDYYTVNVLYNQRFYQRDYLWPIAINEIVKAPSQIIQNPGW